MMSERLFITIAACSPQTYECVLGQYVGSIMDELSSPSFAALFRQYRRATLPTQEELAQRSGGATANLTQKELAQRSGFSIDLVRKIEGKQIPPQRTIEVFADAMRLLKDDRDLLLAAAELERRERKQRQRSVLVGRKHELAAIEKHVKNDGSPLLVFTGIPGIGKSRLLLEVVNRARMAGWTVITGGCYRQIGQEPYTPISDALITFLQPPLRKQHPDILRGCAWLTRLLPELKQAGDLLEPSEMVSPEQERRLLFDAIRMLLANVAGAAGTMLVLDDLQWAGADAIDLLVSLIRTPTAKPIRIVGAFRNTELPPQSSLRLLITDLVRNGLAAEEKVGPLTSHEAADLVQALLKGYQHPERDVTVAKILQQAEGIPFILENFTQVLVAGTWKPGLIGADVPQNVTDLLHQQIVTLPSPAQKLVRVAAVIGRSVPTKLLMSVAAQNGMQEEDINAAAEVLCHAKLLCEQKHDYQFTHDLILQVVMTDMDASRRMMLHRKIAESLEQQPGILPVEKLAHHFLEAEEPERAVIYLERAGFRAQSRLATTQAISYYREWAEQLVHLDRLNEAAHAYQQLSDLLMLSGQHEEAQNVLRVSLLSVTHVNRFLRVRLQLKIANVILGSQYHYNKSHYAEASRVTDQAIAEAEVTLGQAPLEELPEWWQTWLEIKLAQMTWYYGLARKDEMMTLAEQVQPIVERYGTLLQQSNFHFRLALTLFSRDRGTVSDEVLAHKRAALAGYEALRMSGSIVEMRFGLAFDLLWHGDLAEAETSFHVALDMAAEGKFIDTEVKCLIYLAILWRKRGQITETRDFAKRSLEAATTQKMLTYMAVARGNLSWVAWRSGDCEETQCQGQMALALWQQSTGFAYACKWVALWPLIGLATSQERLAEAMAYLRDVLEPQQQRLPDTLSVLVEAAIQAWDAGQQQTARIHLTEAMVVAAQLCYL